MINISIIKDYEGKYYHYSNNHSYELWIIFGFIAEYVFL